MTDNQYYNLLRDSQNNLRDLIELQRYNLEIIDRVTSNRRTNRRIPPRSSRLNNQFSPFYYSWFINQNERQNNIQRNGLSREQINNLTTTDNFENISNPLQITECPITQTEFTNNMIVTRINCCNHIFCKDSLITWLGGHNTCPVCRINILDSNNQNNDNNNNNNNNNDNNNDDNNNDDDDNNNDDDDNITDNTTNINTTNNLDNNFSFYTGTIYDNYMYNNGRRIPLNNTTFTDNLLNSFIQNLNQTHLNQENNNSNQ